MAYHGHEPECTCDQRRNSQVESADHWRRNCFAWKEKSDETERECERLRAERDAARRAGKAEGLREAAEILRGAAEADARNAVYCSAPNHRERLQNLSENELVMAQRMLTRAEEVERG